jgi:hypothetical protein
VKIIGHFDGDGVIRSVLTFDERPGYELSVATRAGRTSAELDGLPLEPDVMNDPERLSDLLRRYKVEPGRARVVPVEPS